MSQAPSSRPCRSAGIPSGGLGVLLDAAARADPDAILLRDGLGGLTAAEVAGRVARLTDYFRQCGLRPGECVLLVMGAETDSLVALIAALRAGLVPALTACGIGPVEIAALAQVAEAAALVGPTHYGDLALGDTYLSAAALAETIRLIATHGPQPLDGAADISADALLANVPMPAVDWGMEGAIIATFDRAASPPVLVAHDQAMLAAMALDLAERGRLAPVRGILSTIVPASLAGLVTGPFAALTAVASLTLHGPFEAARFLAVHDAQPGAHLVAPAAIGLFLQDAGLTRSGGALILLSRFERVEDFVLPDAFEGQRTMVDVYAFGETILVPEPRGGGVARTPVVKG